MQGVTISEDAVRRATEAITITEGKQVGVAPITDPTPWQSAVDSIYINRR